eukprot:g2136.t1
MDSIEIDSPRKRRASSTTAKAILERRSSIDLGKSSFLATFTNTIKGIVGTGVLSIPYAFANLGTLSSIILTIVIALWTYLTYILIHQIYKKALAKDDHVKSFNDVYAMTFGQGFGKALCTVLLFMYAVGVDSAYLAFISENIVTVWGPTAWDEKYIIALLAIPFIAICLLKDMNILKYPSSAGNILLVIVLIYIFVVSYAVYLNTNRTQSVSVSSVGGTTSDNDPGFFAFKGLPIFLGIMLFSFSGQLESFVIISSMQNVNEYPRCIVVALVPLCAIYLAFGSIAFIFSTKTDGIIFENVKDFAAPAVSILRIMYCAIMVTTLPLKMMPIFQIFEGYITSLRLYYLSQDSDELVDGGENYFHRNVKVYREKSNVSFDSQFDKSEKGYISNGLNGTDTSRGIPSCSSSFQWFCTDPLFIAMRCLLCIVSVSVTIGIPDFTFLASLMGSLCIGLMGFTLPPLINLLLTDDPDTSLFISSISLFLFGLIATVGNTTLLILQKVKVL